MPDILYAILYIVGCGLICYVLYWGATTIGAALGAPWSTILLVIVVLVIVLVCVNILMGFFGAPMFGPTLFHLRR